MRPDTRSAIVAIVGVVGILATQSPADTAAARPSQTPAAAIGNEITTARDLLRAGRYAETESLLGPRLANLDASTEREPADALELADLWIEARVKGGKSSESETLTRAEHIVAVRERLGTPVALAISLRNLGYALEERGESGRATEVHERAVAIARSAMSTRSAPPALLVESLGHLARVLAGRERFAEARRIIAEAKALRPAGEPADSAEQARLLLVEALLHRLDGDYERAVSLLDEARAGLPDRRHPDTVAIMQLEGDLMFLQGRTLESTRARWTEALELAEASLGPGHPSVAVLLRRLALVNKASGDLLTARALLERAMRIVDPAHAPCQKDYPELLSDYAGSLAWAADYREARRRYEQALDRSSVCLGRQHSMTATVVHNQAYLAVEMGDFALAERLLRLAVADWSKGLGSTHPYVARGLNQLADVVALSGRDAESRRLLQRVLTLRRQTLGPTHPDVAVTLVRLARLAERAGSLLLASRHLDQAFEIFARGGVTQSPDHLVPALGLRARISARRGDHEGAHRDYSEAAAVLARILSPSHPLAAAARADVARADFARGAPERALDLALAAEADGRDQLLMTARFLPERQALLYADRRPRGLSLALSTLPSPRTGDVSRVFDAVVRSRGLVLDELAGRSRWTAEPVPERAALFTSVSTRRAQFATLMLRSVQGEAVPQTLLEEARQQAEEAELELAEASSADREELARGKAGFEDVRRALPPGSVLISFVRYDRTRIAATSTGTAVSVRPAYLALVASASGADPVALPLGIASAIESAIGAWRTELHGTGSGGTATDATAALRSYRAAGDRLRRLVWDPLLPHLAGAAKVFIVPDGALNLVSFPSLPIGNARYLVEVGPVVHILSTERDLLGQAAPRQGRGLLAVGGPSYDAKPSAAAVASTRGSQGGCGNGVALRFGDLPGTRAEIRDVAGAWAARPGAASAPGPHDLLLLDRHNATKKAVLEAARGRLVLHIATHGFFLGSDCPPASAGTRGVGGIVANSPRPETPSRNPLLISGLAFAGANVKAAAAGAVGILTAEEVAVLDLQGTQWAVLSACDTGLGEIRTGEGVFGLRRAFQIAGVRTVIMSLWSVEDQSTRVWMRTLYRERFEMGASTADAVHSASLQTLQSRRARGQNPHPFYWAAFVAAGDWR